MWTTENRDAKRNFATHSDLSVEIKNENDRFSTQSGSKSQNFDFWNSLVFNKKRAQKSRSSEQNEIFKEIFF